METTIDPIVVDLRPLSTSSDNCLVLTTGPVQEDRLLQALEQRFDQLPVIDSSGRLQGLIATDTAEKFRQRGEPLEPGDKAIRLNEVPVHVDLFVLLAEIEKDRALVFRDRPHNHSSQQDWFAIVTLSDLNRHPFRAYLYPLFAQLESALAEIIRMTYEDPWDWIKWTPNHSRPTIVGRWQMDRRENIEVSPVNGCELRDLLFVLNCSSELKKLLSYSDDEVTKLVNSLPDLRNDIMHPVRALVDSKKTVGRLRRQLERLASFADRATIQMLELQRRTRMGYRAVLEEK